MRGTVVNCFCVKQQKVRTTCIPCDFWVSIGATVKKACKWQLEKKHWKIRFYGIYIEIKQLGIENDVIKIKFEYHLKWFSTIHYRRPWWESWTQQHAFRLCTFSTLWDSSWPEKLLSKILLTFLFDRRRLNNVSAEALFHGGHLVMRSERCAVQN